MISAVVKELRANSSGLSCLRSWCRCEGATNVQRRTLHGIWRNQCHAPLHCRGWRPCPKTLNCCRHCVSCKNISVKSSKHVCSTILCFMYNEWSWYTCKILEAATTSFQCLCWAHQGLGYVRSEQVRGICFCRPSTLCRHLWRPTKPWSAFCTLADE